MTWETVIIGALQGVSDFIYTLISVLGGALNPAAIEGLTFLFLLGIVIRVINVGPKIPGKIAERIKKMKDDDEEFEWVMTRRKK